VLVTTSATADSLLADPFSEATGDAAADGDGMAPPAALVAANAARAAAVVGQPAAEGLEGWAPPPPGAGGADAGFMEHALEALTAQVDHDGLQGTGTGRSGFPHADSSLARQVAALQRQVSRAAAAAYKAGAPLAGAAARSTLAAVARSGSTGAGAAAPTPATAATAAKPATMAGTGAEAKARPASPAAAALQDKAPLLEAHPNAHWDAMATEDEGAQEGPAPDVLLHAAAAAAKERGAAAPAAVAAGTAGAAAPRAVAAAASTAQHPVYRDPASRFLVADAPDDATRHIVIVAPPALEARFGRIAAQQRLAANSDLVAFEAYTLGAKVNRALYDEALALYNRLLPLVMDHLADCPSGRVCLSGAGLGGSLATLLALMAVHRGLRPGALAPVVALNAPAVLCEVPDFSRWCAKEGCSLEDVGAMVEDAVARGVLSELGLQPSAVMNVYFNPEARADGAGGAAAAAAAAVVSLAGGARSAAGEVAGALRRLDSGLAHRLTGSALVPEPLKAWLRAGGEALAEGPGLPGLGGRPLQILNPIGRILWYEPTAKATAPAPAGVQAATHARPPYGAHA
jgi:hypothetical protein